MAESERIWAAPNWIAYKKHRPPQNVKWRDVVRSTGEMAGEAAYHPNISPEKQEIMEMEIVASNQPFAVVKHKRMFFRDLHRIIGASAGEETSLVYVEHLSTGEVHGRPITSADLRRKGADI